MERITLSRCRTAPAGAETQTTWDTGLVHRPIERVKAGRELLSQGFPAHDVVLIRSGLAKLIYSFPDGRSAIVGLRGRHSLLGVGPALLEAPQSLTAVTVSVCTVSRVPADEFALMVRQDEALAWQVNLQHARELQREFDQTARLACLSARERLRSFLALLRTESHDHAAITLPLRDWELAQMLAVTPQYLSRLMHELVAEGRLTRSGKSWLLSDGPCCPGRNHDTRGSSTS